MRAASRALQAWWPDGESSRSWRGVTWGGDRVWKLDLSGSKLEVLAPEIGQLTALTLLIFYDCSLKELPPEFGQLTLKAPGGLHINGCPELTLAPGATVGGSGFFPAYARLLIVEPRKETPGKLHAFLLDNPLAVPAFFKYIVDDATYANWLGEAAEATPKLAHLTSPDGSRRVIDVSPPLIVQACKDTPDKLHAFLLDNPLAVPAFFKSILTDAAHAKWLGEAVKATPSIAHLKDTGGRHAIDVAVPACHQAMQDSLFRPATPGQLYKILLDNRLAVPLFFKSILTKAAHADWLGEAVKATPKLAGFTDADGRRAVDVAHATCRRRMQESSWLCNRYELQLGPPEHLSATSVVIRADDHGDKLNYAQIFDDADKDQSGTLELKELDVVAEELGLSKDLIVSEASKLGSATSTDGGTAIIHLRKDAFVSVCKKLLGDGPRQVVIKLMKDKVQWQREMESRSWEWNAADKKYVPSQNEEPLDAQYVVQALDAPTQAVMAAAVSESQLLQQLAEKYMDNASIKEYAYPVVMDAANRNLAQIYLQERPGHDSLRDLARQIFEAVQHLHSRKAKLMHGDLKVRAPPLLDCSATSVCQHTRHTCLLSSPAARVPQPMCNHTHADAQLGALHHGRQAPAHRLRRLCNYLWS